MPRIDYDTASTWAATIPTRQWSKLKMQTGGADRASTWLGASYEVSSANMLRVRVRYLETEEEDVFAWIEYLRSWPNTGTFYPDQDDLSTSRSVDVQSPMKGADLEGQPDPDYPEAREIEVVLRDVAGLGWPIYWFS
jgi:hypothetical protein